MHGSCIVLFFMLMILFYIVNKIRHLHKCCQLIWRKKKKSIGSISSLSFWESRLLIQIKLTKSQIKKRKERNKYGSRNLKILQFTLNCWDKKKIQNRCDTNVGDYTTLFFSS